MDQLSNLLWKMSQLRIMAGIISLLRQNVKSGEGIKVNVPNAEAGKILNMTILFQYLKEEVAL